MHVSDAQIPLTGSQYIVTSSVVRILPLIEGEKCLRYFWRFYQLEIWAIEIYFL